MVLALYKLSKTNVLHLHNVALLYAVAIKIQVFDLARNETYPALTKLKVVHERRVVILTDLKKMEDYYCRENILHANILLFLLLTVLRQQLLFQIPNNMEQAIYSLNVMI